MIDESQLSGKGVDLFAHVHRCIAEAMLIAALGKVSTLSRGTTISLVLTTYHNYHLQHNVNDLNLQVTEETAHAIAVMTGMYQNTSPFARTYPTLWKVVTWYAP